MTWLYYLLESNLYLAVFYGFYLVFLQKETFYGINRIYLISSSIFSFLVPFLQVGILNQLIYGANKLSLAYTNPNLGKAEDRNLTMTLLMDVVLVMYILVAFYFIVTLVIGFYGILRLALKAKKQTTGGITYIELKNSLSAFSFFNLLFINPASKEKLTIVKHEMVHIRQRHSIDILFFELLKALNWFNPLVYLIQKDIKLLHEYIADQLTTNSDIGKHEYAMFLIQNSFGVSPSYLTNQIFNQSILKRRINMLNKKRSAGRARLKILLAVPIVGGMLLASTVGFSKDYAMLDLYPEKYSEGSSQLQKIIPPPQTPRTPPNPPKKKKSNSDKVIKFPPPIVKKDQIKFPPPIVKKDEIIIPPPIVVKDGELPPPPPPPVRKSKYRTGGKKGVIKFPPPIVKPDNKMAPPPPPVEPPSSAAASKESEATIK